ncbi:alpha/beta fold hydrolase [Kitasatospora sp. NPDC003701]
MFVHGIGGPRDEQQEHLAWRTALAEGAKEAGHADAVPGLLDGSLVDSRFADYSDLFVAAGAQGADGEQPSEAEADFVTALLWELIDELDRQAAGQVGEERTVRIIKDARFQLGAASSGVAHAQGLGEPFRLLIQVATTLMQIPGVRAGAQWASGRALLMALAQVGRYLGRGEADSSGRTLDALVRERVLGGLDETRPLVVVSHSLGSVVAYEALHQYTGPVALWVTIGSPLATGAVVLQRLVPRPPHTPLGVARWLNFWDRDDIIVSRPRIEKWMTPNQQGVAPDTSRVESNGLWVHTATKYLRQKAVAGPVMEALQR